MRKLGVRDLRRKIRGVTNIRQITEAMERVATTKLMRMQRRAQASRPYSDAIERIVGHLARLPQALQSRLLERREVRRAAILLLSADRGLCGAYNSNMFRFTQRLLRELQAKAEVAFVVLGKRGRGHFEKRGHAIHRFVDRPVEKVGFEDVKELTGLLVEEFLEGRFDEVHLVYSEFVSLMGNRLVRAKLLPVDPEYLAARAGEEEMAIEDTILEPEAGVLLDRLLPRYLETKVWSGLLQSLASEYAARRVAMKNATDNTEELLGELSRMYNRARQEAITKELLEVVGGAEGLR